MRKELPYCATGSAIKGYNESAIAKRENNDCVVRAFASAFDISYDKAHKYVKEKFGRKDGDGTFGTAITLDKMSKERTQVNHKKIKTMGRKVGYSSFKTLDYEVKVKGQKTVRKMTVGTFTKQNPVGSFLILVSGHAFTIKNGVVIGNWEDPKKLKKIINFAFEVK